MDPLVESLSPCLRRVDDERRLYPLGYRVELVFLVEAANYLLLRTEGAQTANIIYLPSSAGPAAEKPFPVILPEKLQAVARRRMLQHLRAHASNWKMITYYVKEAARRGYTSAYTHLSDGWNCTIHPPLAGSGEKATDLGMDYYCPACTLFGYAVTAKFYTPKRGTDKQSLLVIGRDPPGLESKKYTSKSVSVGVKSRVHFDPAFALYPGLTEATHNKVTEGEISHTGTGLFREFHVEPGTVFVGRLVLTDVTRPELLSMFHTVATMEEIGGRAGVYGTIKVHPVGVRCGRYSHVTALELAKKLARTDVKLGVEDVLEHIKKKGMLKGFHMFEEDEITGMKELDPKVYESLWESSLAYATQVSSRILELLNEAPPEGEG